MPFLIFLCGCATTYNSATGKEHVSFISTEREIKIGKSVSEKITEYFGIVYDQDKQSRIEKIGKKLAEASARYQIIYNFEILDEKEPNAMALPGGYIYITKGLFEDLDTDDQIAAVLAHEMAHVEARHSIYRLQEALGYSALMVIINSNAEGNKQKTSAAISQLFLSYSRRDEFEADRLAVGYMKKTGYNPLSMIEVLNKLKEIDKKKPIELIHAHTHPYIYDRIRELKIVLSGNIDINDYMNKTYDTEK